MTKHIHRERNGTLMNEYVCDECMGELVTRNGVTGYIYKTGRVDPDLNVDVVQIFCADCHRKKVRGV